MGTVSVFKVNIIFLYKTTLAQSKKAECLNESSFDMVGE